MRRILDLFVWLLVIAAISGALYTTTVRSASDREPCTYVFHESHPTEVCPFCGQVSSSQR